MPDFEKAGALLVGTGRHGRDSGLVDVPNVASTVKDLRDVLVRTCGIDPGRIQVLLDPRTPYDLGTAITRFAEKPVDPLLLYYVGHGMISEDGRLHLATAGTDSRTAWVPATALPYDVARGALRNSAARSIVVVLDCCFSARALGFLGKSDEQIAAMAEVEGGYVLTSAGRDQLALASEGQPYTAFTGQLLRLLTDGDPAEPRELTLEDAYRYLARKLPAANYPRPHRRATGCTGDLVLTPNPARLSRPSAEPAPPGQTNDPGPSDPPPKPPRRKHAVISVAVISVAAAITAGIVLRPGHKPPAPPHTSKAVAPPSTTTATSSRHTSSPSPTRAIRRTATGQNPTRAPASTSPSTPASLAIVISRGADTSSSDCQKPDCSWINAQLTGFQPHTTYRVVPFSWHVFSEPCVATTDANGSATCNDVRYDVPKTTVYEYVETPAGRIKSNKLYWAPR